jgi:hypothetical protein
MSKLPAISAAALLSVFCSALNAQAAALKQQKAAALPAPKRDISGIWDPARLGIGGSGAKAMPADGRHEPPYTPLGLAASKKNRSSNGPQPVAVADENDPAHMCDPQGFPRQELFELRTVQILQQPIQTVILYTYDRIWRTIWTDGRALPKDPDPHWYGYSIGKWKDDYTFVVETKGTDERTWIDNAGRPHSEDLRVEEQFHRIDHDNLELSVTIDDPKFYTRPWVALDKLHFRLKPANFELQEMMCSPSEVAEYNRRHAGRGAEKPH